MAAPTFHAGALINVEIPAASRRTVPRRVLVWRPRGDRFDCVLSDDDGGLALATIAPAGAGRWTCIGDPVAVGPRPAVHGRG